MKHLSVDRNLSIELNNNQGESGNNYTALYTLALRVSIN